MKFKLDYTRKLEGGDIILDETHPDYISSIEELSKKYYIRYAIVRLKNEKES